MDLFEYQTLLLQIIILLLVATLTVGCVIIFYFLKISRAFEERIASLPGLHAERTHATPRRSREVRTRAVPGVVERETPIPPVESPVETPLEPTEDSLPVPPPIPVVSPTVIDQPPAGSLEEIKDRYSLGELTLATDDGLLIGSTEQDREQAAARYSARYAETGEGWEDGAFLFSLIYKGSTVIGIAGSDVPLTDSTRASIVKDVRVVLSKLV